LGSLLSFHNTAFSLEFYGDLTNNGTITSAPATADNKVHTFKGSTLINNGVINPSIFNMDSVANVSGTGTFSPTNYLSVGANGNITLLSNVTFSPGGNFYVFTSGILNPNGNTINYTSGTLEIQSGGTIVNSGLVKTQNAVILNLRAGSFFNAPLNVSSGSTTRATDFTSPYIGRLYGNVTVDAGGTLTSSLTSSNTAYVLEFYGNLTNNGTLTTISQANNKRLTFKGSVLINNGVINPERFTMDSVSNVSGTGAFAPTYNLGIGANGNITLLSDVTFSPANQFILTSGAILNPNGNTINYTSGTLELNNGATITNSGLFKTQNAVTFNLRGGSAFNAPLNVTSGSIVAATDLTSPYLGELFGDVTVDAGGTLGSYMAFYNTSFKLDIYGNLTNNGTITANSAANKTLTFYGSAFVNNGLVSHRFFNFNSIATLSGTGSFTSNTSVLSGAAITLNSNHQFANLTINAGGTFNMDNWTVGFTSSNPITQNGTLSNANSMIEYIGTALQTISTSNIVYHKLRINNANGTSLAGNVTVNDTLSVILGDLDMNTRILTLSATGYLTETPGNTVTGGTGYITTTRNVGIPSSLNIGGLGAVLTATTDLGNTEIRRGHAVQTGGSIKRYYDISPANNSGLTATLKFKYDESELVLRPESILRLKKSTNSGASYILMGGSANPSLNEITLSGISSFSRWTADSSGTSAVIGMAIQGFYNSASNRLNMLDTVRVYFRNSSPPYNVIDSGISILDSVTLNASFVLPSLTTGTYFLQIKHRNSIETWSSIGVSYTSGNTLVYSFLTSTAQAFGSNMIQVDASPLRFAIYGGDVNQDGTIDATDVSLIDNDAQNFISGYVLTDITGDRFADGSDFAIADNNAANFVSVVIP